MKLKIKTIWYPSSMDGVRCGAILNDGTYRNEGEYIAYTEEESLILFNVKWNIK